MNYTEIPFCGIDPQSQNWGLTRFDTQFSSSLNGSTQTVLRGSRWTADVTWKNSTTVKKNQTIQAFLEQMTDKSNMTRIVNFTYQSQGSFAGSPKFVSGTLMAKTIVLGGFTPNANNVAVFGDLIQLATDQLVRVTSASVDANGSGQASININPGLREVPAANSAVITTKPSCLMQFASAGYSGDFRPPRIGGFSVSFIEVIQ